MIVDDWRDQKCPEPIMNLSARLASVESGQCVVFLSDDPASLRDVPKYCQAFKHSVVIDEGMDCPRFTVTKA